MTWYNDRGHRLRTDTRWDSPLSKYIRDGQSSVEELNIFIENFYGSNIENHILIVAEAKLKLREVLVKLWIEE